MMLALNKNIFSLKKGDILTLIIDTYALEICDVCGKKRKCDWFEQTEKLTGIDVCRECRKKIFDEEAKE